MNQDLLHCLKELYDNNKTIIDEQVNKTFTFDFLTEERTNVAYPKAIICMGNSIHLMNKYLLAFGDTSLIPFTDTMEKMEKKEIVNNKFIYKFDSKGYEIIIIRVVAKFNIRLV